MIYSNKHRFIFFATPKTATHALRQALTPRLGTDDWEQQVLYGQSAAPIPALASIKHGHISAAQLRPHVSDADWDSFLKFGFVRNPFDRFVSTCFFLNRNNENFAPDATRFMKRALRMPNFKQRILVRPQVELLTGSDGQLALDIVGRYESLQASFDEISAALGLPTVDLARKNASKHKSYTEYYDDELIESVAKFYADDFEKFSYDPELISAKN